MGGRGTKSNPLTILFYSLKMKYLQIGIDVQRQNPQRVCGTELQRSAFCTRKKSEILGKNPPKIRGAAHTREVWKLSRDRRRTSSGTGSAPVPPSGEEIFGVKVFAFPLNSPKMGGQRGELMVPQESTRGVLQSLRVSPRSGEKFLAKSRFTLEAP